MSKRRSGNNNENTAEILDWNSKYLEKVIDTFYHLKKYDDENLIGLMLGKDDSLLFVDFVKSLETAHENRKS